MMTAVLVMRSSVLLPAICASFSKASKRAKTKTRVRTGEEDHVALLAAEGDVVRDEGVGEDARVPELFEVENGDVGFDDLGSHAGSGESSGRLGEREEAVNLSDDVDGA